MKKSLLPFFTFTLMLLISGSFAGFGQTYHDLSTGSFTQNWTNTELITANDNWTGVPSMQGFLGNGDAASPTGIDPQTVLTPLVDLDVIANQANPNTATAGGVAEFNIADPVVALQGSGTADYPYLVIFLNATGRSNIRVQYNLRDIDGSGDNAVQQFALQYRIGTSGNFVNLPSGYIADASTGPSLATLVTPVDVTLPGVCNGQAELQVRIITTNAVGSDEWVGIDDIIISSIADVTPPSVTFNPAAGATNVPITVNPVISFNEAARKIDGAALADADLASLITFKKTSSSGEDVGFNATIDATKQIITIVPSASLTNSQVYYLALSPVEDLTGNETSAANITFTTISADAPSITLTFPVGGETFHAEEATNITWTSSNVTTVNIEAYVLHGDLTEGWETMGTASGPSGTFSMNVPADAAYWTGYKIRVSVASDASVNSVSGAFTVIPVVASLSEIRARIKVDDIVKIKSEVTLTFKRTTRNQKYIQDANAGILIDDPTGVLLTTLSAGDNFTGLEGKLATYNGVLELVPTNPSVAVVSSGNSVTIPEMTLSDYNTNYLTYESRLIKLSDVTFPSADGSSLFGSGTGIDITDGTNTISFRTFTTGESNIIGTVIPSDHIKMTCLAAHSNATVQVFSRSLSDFEILPTGVEKINGGDLFRIYPVPATSVLNISNVEDLRSVEILDMNGKVIETITTDTWETLQIPVSTLSRGLYILRFNTDEGRIIRRFVKL